MPSYTQVRARIPSDHAVAQQRAVSGPLPTEHRMPRPNQEVLAREFGNALNGIEDSGNSAPDLGALDSPSPTTFNHPDEALTQISVATWTSPVIYPFNEFFHPSLDMFGLTVDPQVLLKEQDDLVNINGKDEPFMHPTVTY